MPTYNSAERIARSIKSHLAQDFTDFELVISDNASTDKTQEVCEQYANSDSRIRYIRQDENIGQITNFDYVVDAAKGRYFMWAHDDDFYDPRFISTLKPVLDANSNIGFVMSAIQRIDESENIVGMDHWVGDDDPESLGVIKHAFAAATGFANRKRYHLFMFSLFRTRLIQQARSYGSNEVPHPDRLFMTQLALAAPARFIDEPLYLRTVHPASMNERLPDDLPNIRINEDPWGYARTVLALAPTLWRSPIIPRRRKLAIPILVLAMGNSYRHHLYRGDSPLIKIVSTPYRLARRVGAILLRRKSKRSPPQM